MPASSQSILELNVSVDKDGFGLDDDQEPSLAQQPVDMQIGIIRGDQGNFLVPPS